MFIVLLVAPGKYSLDCSQTNPMSLVNSPTTAHVSSPDEINGFTFAVKIGTRYLPNSTVSESPNG